MGSRFRNSPGIQKFKIMKQEKLFGLMSEYDDIEGKYIMLGGEKETY